MNPGGHSPLVLIVEDEAPIRRFLRATLESQGYRVKEAETARDGLLQCRTQRPDLVLLDLGLPDGDGLTLGSEIAQYLVGRDCAFGDVLADMCGAFALYLPVLLDDLRRPAQLERRRRGASAVSQVVEA